MATCLDTVKPHTSYTRKLQLEFDGLKKRYWGQHIWARGYFVATADNVTEDMIREYIKNQKVGGDDEDFRIINP
jgi:putative transposase